MDVHWLQRSSDLSQGTMKAIKFVAKKNFKIRSAKKLSFQSYTELQTKAVIMPCHKTKLYPNRNKLYSLPGL